MKRYAFIQQVVLVSAMVFSAVGCLDSGNSEPAAGQAEPQLSVSPQVGLGSDGATPDISCFGVCAQAFLACEKAGHPDAQCESAQDRCDNNCSTCGSPFESNC